jgi:hypothetical protein
MISFFNVGHTVGFPLLKCLTCGSIKNVSRVQMKSWAGKALDTLNCCAFLKCKFNWSMLTVNLKFINKTSFFFFSFL